MSRIGRISDNWQRSGFFSYIAPHIGSGSYPGSPYILDRYSSGERTSLLCTDVRLDYKCEGRPGAILGSPCSLFSESTGLEFHTCIILVEFCLVLSAATCYGMRQSSVYSLRVEALDHVVGWLVLSFAVSPGTWPGGAWVPGGPRPCFLLLLLFHDPNFVFRNFHQDVSRFTVHKGLRPNSRIMYRSFTSHQPMMNEQDQVTWTNWPASKKKIEHDDLDSFEECFPLAKNGNLERRPMHARKQTLQARAQSKTSAQMASGNLTGRTSEALG